MTTQPLIMEENGKRYRLLLEGETLESGDIMKDAIGVLPMGNCIGVKIRSEESGVFPQGFYWRPISENVIIAQCAEDIKAGAVVSFDKDGKAING